MPLATLAATVGPTGISAPTYDEIYLSLQQSWQAIFGTDGYIAPDSQDGQFLAIVAKGVSDANTMAINVYNNFSPATSQGAGLSSGVKLNGLARRIPSFSTVDVKVVGVAGTAIPNGVVSDQQQAHLWNLPALVTVPLAGEIVVTATCQDAGSVEALAHTVTRIVTPTLGWQTVDNATEAAPGQPVESDAQLRRRQALATQVPSTGNVGAVLSGLLLLPGVADVAIHENWTDAIDSDGVPEHCIACVVVGGNVADIAAMIALKKAPGCDTFGTTSEATQDPNGLPIVIEFSRPSEIVANVVVNVHPIAGYNPTIEALIVSAVEDFLGALNIAQTLYFNSLWVPASLSGTPESKSFHAVSMTLNGATLDITPGYDERVIAGTVTVNQV